MRTLLTAFALIVTLTIMAPSARAHCEIPCGIYDDRPEICREYSNDYCEFDQPAEEGFELYFDSYPALLAYCRKRFKRWGERPY